MAAALSISFNMALAWPRMPRDDIKTAREANMIVLGRLKEGSIHCFRPSPGSSCHDITLLVTSILKGTPPTGELRIRLAHGLAPATAGKFDPLTGFSFGDNPAGALPGVILWDIGGIDQKITGDIREDHIWFLRLMPDEAEGPRHAEVLGISEPGEVWPAALLPFARALLLDEPGAEMSRLGREDTAAGRQAADVTGMRVLAVVEKNDSPETRAKAALPFWMNDRLPDSQSKAGSILANCGIEGFRVLEKPASQRSVLTLQLRALSLIGCINTPESERLLVDVLRKEQVFWNSVQIDRADEFEPPPGARDSRQERLDSKQRCETCIRGLARIGKSRDALAVAEAMERLWEPLSHPLSSTHPWSMAVTYIRTRMEP